MSTKETDEKHLSYAESDSQNSGNNEYMDTVVKSEAEKKLVKKINRNVLPLIFFIILFQFCDKSALSVAAVLGIKEDTNISLTQFNWIGSIFYLGFFICQVANSFIIQKVRPRYYLGSALVIWGLVMGGTAACNSFSQLAACRFLLGLLEGVTYPCIYIVLNTLYRRSEQSLVWGFLGISIGGGTVIGVLIAFGFSKMDGINGWRAWRWGYIIFGIGTVVVGIFTLIFMIDDPYHKLLKLTEEEKVIVNERIKDNRVVRVTEIKWSQVIEALKEPKFYIIFLINAANCLQNGGIVTYSTILVENLGFKTVMSIILQIPNGLATAIFAIGAVYVAHRINKTCVVALGTSVIGAFGFVLLLVIPGRPKLLGFYFTWAMNGSTSLLQTIVSNNVSGYTKKVFYNNMFMVANTVGNFCGPFMMVESQSPKYIGAMTGYIITNMASFFGFLILYFLFKRENQKRKEHLSESVDVNLDLTDVQNKSFVYRY